MGYALKYLSPATRLQIASNLFVVEKQIDNGGDHWLHGLCPFHADTRASFGYNVTQDFYKCQAQCCESSDLVDLWCLLNGHAARSREGIKAFKRQFGATGPNEAGKTQTPSRVSSEPKNVQKKARTAIPETVYTELGAIPQEMLAELRQRRGWSQDVINIIGIKLLTHFHKHSSPYKLFPIKERRRLAIPIRDENGILWNIRIYYPFSEDIPQDGIKIKSWANGYGNARLFPSPTLLRPEGPIILCEGEADTICAISHGLNAITQTSKTAHWPEEHVKYLAGRDIFIAYDADKPGQEYARKAAKSLHKAGCKIRIIDWPDFMGRNDNGSWPDKDGQDLTDFFAKHGKDATAFSLLMDKAHTYPDVNISNDNSILKDDSGHRFWKPSVNGRLSFCERALADYLIETQPVLYHDKSGQLYRWEGTYYEPFSEERLKKIAIDALGDDASSSRVGETYKMVKSLVSTPHGRDINDLHDWVCLKNGMLNLYTLEFKPHAPEYLSTIKLNVTWHFGNNNLDAAAREQILNKIRPNRWIQFWSETVQTENVIEQVQEFFGYCMTRETKFGKALLFYGKGSDGKSKAIAVLRALVGPQNCSAVSMTGLDDQFQRAALFGKLLNVATEITTDAIQSEFFKSIVTGDPIQASFKHKDGFEFVPYCKLVYATNKMPRVLDNSDGYFRRILPIEFKKQFFENDPAIDTDLEKKLMEELDGIFLWSLTGLHRLMAQKRFTVADETLNFMMKYRRYNNPIMAFVQDCCIIDATKKITIKDLYKQYKTYCSEGGFKPANRENFYEELTTAVRKLAEDAALRRSRPREKDGSRPDYIEGIDLNYIPKDE
jgi:putative DNA primase/helicase